MKITLKWLKKHGACIAGKVAFAAQEERDGIAIIKLLIATNIDWANWLICQMFTRKQEIMYAVFAAEQVLPIFEAKYPNDNRLRLAIAAAKKVIIRNTIKNRSAAASCAVAAAAARAAARVDVVARADVAFTAVAAAADAVASAAYAAAAVASAAYAAARAAAVAAAADAAASTAYAAAYAAALASSRAADAAVAAVTLVRAKMQTKIITYGLSLLEEKK